MSVSPPRRRSRGSPPLILRGGLAVVVLVAALVTVPGVPARAEHDCTEEVELRPNGKVKIIRVCEPHDGGGDSGDRSQVSCEQTFWPVDTEPSDDAVYGGPLMWYRDIEIREDGGIWGEAYFSCTNHDTGEVFDDSWWVCYAACGGSGEVPEGLDGLLQEALAQVNPPLPGIRHTFDRPADDGAIRAVVNAETWWWAEDDHAAIVRADADGPVWVRVTASPGPLTVDPGDGSDVLECAGLGVPYNPDQSYWDQVPGEPRGACVHVYEQVAESITATMSVTWMVTYEGFAPGFGTVSGVLDPLIRQQTATFAVKEIQSVIVR